MLRALSPNADPEGVVAALQDHAENYLVNLVHPIEYNSLIDEAPTDASDWINPALTLCYRTGLRFSELSAVATTRITGDEGGLVAVTLDHQQKRPLKTFHSRRIIPLDVLLEESEREALQTLIQTQSARPFPSDLDANHPKVIGRSRAVVDPSTSVFPLRHAWRPCCGPMMAMGTLRGLSTRCCLNGAVPCVTTCAARSPWGPSPHMRLP